jgi:hypothetical protein
VLARQLAATLRKDDGVSTEFAARPSKWPTDEIATAVGSAALRRSWREGIAGTTPAKWARDSAYVQAHSTDVRRACHALTHFLLCTTRRGKVGLGTGRGWCARDRC